jgi:magnesium-dependent phosphatase 1
VDVSTDRRSFVVVATKGATIDSTTQVFNNCNLPTTPSNIHCYLSSSMRTAAFVRAGFLAASSTLNQHVPFSTRRSMTEAAAEATCGVVGIDYPQLVVFDLDACLWDQEMYEMTALPDQTMKGPLNDLGEGVTGVYSGHDKISLHKGSLLALQEHAQNKYPGMKICFASSADTPFAEKVGRATLKLLEVVPGMTVWDLVMRDWDNQDVNQIGRQPPLSSNKAKSHFPRIREITGIPYNKMLFFDDCNWGDHCGMVERACKENGKSVVTHRTPSGLREADWKKGLELYKKAQQK